MAAKQRLITRETMDAIAEHVLSTCRCAREERDLIRGLFFITEEAIREAVEHDRHRTFALFTTVSRQ